MQDAVLTSNLYCCTDVSASIPPQDSLHRSGPMSAVPYFDPALVTSGSSLNPFFAALSRHQVMS